MKKYIPEHKVQRMRNLVSKKFGDKTKIQIGYGSSEGKHVEGDVWEENGKTWTIKNGITQTVTKLDSVRRKVNMPLVCPKCNTRVMKGELDKMFWKLYDECMDCRIFHETELKIKGKYKQYEKDIMLKNFKSYMKDLKHVAEDFIGNANRKGYITEAGKVEDWSTENTKEVRERINARIESMEKDLTKKYENMHKE
tara:strand:- start:681 stop:1268 length:588 start_codon:yes stop_codon:yes gene_type:complete